ncbi:MAG: coiled-coil domain-containing protein [Spirochaetota bacterium]
MGYAIKVYEAFKDDEVKAKVLAEFIEKVEEAINNNQVATRQDLHVQELKLTKEIKEVELRLTKEIEQVRADLTKEIEQVRADLTKEIEQVRNEMKEIELKLTKEIEQVRAELKVEIQQTKVSLLKWLIGLLLTQTITIIGVIVGLFQVFK